MGVFLVVGLNGCSDKCDDPSQLSKEERQECRNKAIDCKDRTKLEFAPQSVIENCNKQLQTSHSSSSTGTAHSDGGGNALMWFMLGRSTSPSGSTSSGYFSPSSSSSSHGSSSLGG